MNTKIYFLSHNINYCKNPNSYLAKYRTFDLKLAIVEVRTNQRASFSMDLVKGVQYSIGQSEQDLWIAFRNGHIEAYSCLYKKYYQKLYNYGINLGLDSLQASDAIQDIFLKLFERPDLITNVSTLSSFLFRSIRNYFINCITKENRYVDINENVISFSFDYSIEESLVAEEEKHAITKLVAEVLSGLTSRQKEIIYFRYMYEMDYEEIAQIMNISQQSARNLLYKAFEKIRKKYPQYLPLIIWLIKNIFSSN